MSVKGLRDRENASARPENERRSCLGLWYYCESAVELSKAIGRGHAVSLCQGLKRRIEIGTQIEVVSNTTKLNNLVSHRKRRDELRALRGLGRIRQNEEPAEAPGLPVVRRPDDRARRETPQIA